MEFEPDKEIDLLLRTAAQRETVVSQTFNAHADADEIALFAENALTNKARTRVVEHLADCAKCRKILSNVIALNAEDSSEIVHTKKSKTAVNKAAVPWYRKLFVFPNLAYTLGGLTVLLGGMLAFIAFQGINKTSNAPSVAQMEKTTVVERPRDDGAADSDGERVSVETFSAPPANPVATPALTASNAATVGANSAANASVSPKTFSNSAASISADGADKKASESKKKDSAEEEKSLRIQETAPSENRISADSIAGLPSRDNYSISRSQPKIAPDSRNIQSRRVNELPTAARRSETAIAQSLPQAAAAPPKTENDDRARSADDSRADEKTKSFGGKRFIRKEGVWYDAAYNQQKPTNIRRNSEDYKKLDSELRAIADSLGGTIVIVWKDRAYRIQ